MLTRLLDRYSAEIDRLEQSNLRRELATIGGLDFTSNDFLGLNRAEPIRLAMQQALNDGVSLGAGGSRLLRGNHLEHQRLESQAARLFGSEKTLFLSSGYTANFALFTTLPEKQDLVVYDALSHASIREGVFTTRAKSVKARHNDPDAVERAIVNWRKYSAPSAVAWIAVESLYSMDGDRAPLKELISVAERCDAMLVVDEAHATGVFGTHGLGLTEPYQGYNNLIVLHTCGKALGAAGALVCASSEIIDFLVNRCRPFIYSTAPPPIIAIAVGTSLTLLTTQPERRQKLHRLIETANHELERLFGITGSGSQIIPFVIGEEAPTRQVARELQDAGFDVRAIRPPTVPSGTSRLRISITLNVTEQDICKMLQTLRKIMDRLKVEPKPI
ncbi:MAG: 8-amino-7-oxononanoate synthase [Acidiferrobacterales bacterium]|nr:8-amino-7-oxononanoate synthase [Acidiferrobacterales bacterium]